MANAVMTSVRTAGLGRLVGLGAGGARLEANVRLTFDQLEHELVDAVRDHMHFVRGYETGELRESVRAERPDPMELRVGSDVGHAAYVEYGTSRMSAEPYMAPALEEMRPVIALYLEEASADALLQMTRSGSGAAGD